MEKSRLESVCLVRWIAALFVMTGHMYCLMGGNPPSILWNAIQRLGIIIFFVLGGYLVSGSWARDPYWKNYVIKRAVRIFPPLILFVVIAACVAGPLLSSLPIQEYVHNPLFYRYFMNILLYINYALPGVFETNPYPNAVNGSIWSLPVEVFMYIVVPFFYVLSKKHIKCNIVIVVTVCVLGIVKRIWCPSFFYVIYGTDLGSMIEVVPFYFIGMLIYILQEKGKLRITFDPGMAVAIVFLSTIWVGVSQLDLVILSFVFIPYVVFSLANSKGNIVTKILSKYEITYGIFLYGFFIQQCVIYLNLRNGWNFNFWMLYTISLIATVVVACCSYFWVEKPLIHWSKRFLRKQEG